MSEEVKIVAIIGAWILSLLSILAFCIGAEAADMHGQCRYVSVADYYPARALGCELFKNRWGTKGETK